MYIYVQLCITNVANPQLSQTINLMLKSHHFFCSEFVFNITVSVNINIYFRNQKRVLEEKLRALEAEHAASKHLADSRPAPTVIHGQPPPQLINGYPTITEQQQLSSGYSWSVPPNHLQASSSSSSMTSQTYITSAGSQPPFEQYMEQRSAQRIDMRVPLTEQHYPVPVTLLPREPVVSSLPKQYVPLSQRQEVNIPPQRPIDTSTGIYPPNYTSALSQIQSQGHMSQSYGMMQPPSQPQQYIPSNVPPVSSLGRDRVQHPSLSMSSLSSTSGEYYPQTFPTPSLPIPSIVDIMPTASYVPQQDHTKKIKDYQQYLLQRHEQSKKVLADTRAEIERRRQELLQRFPQLASKSPESTETSKEEDQPSSSSAGAAVQSNVPPVQSNVPPLQSNVPPLQSNIPPLQIPQTVADTAELSPSKAAISSLVSKLAAEPYYALRLGIGKPEEGSKPEVTQASKKFKDVRKSLPFDESLQESPFAHVHDSGGKSRRSDFDSTMNTDDGRKDLDDTAMSSSTDRGSPQLHGRKSVQTVESDLDTSESNGKDRNEIPDKRQDELKKQLEEIQKQKDAILQRHDMAHLRLHAEQERLKYQMAEEQRQNRLTPEVITSEGQYIVLCHCYLVGLFLAYLAILFEVTLPFFQYICLCHCYLVGLFLAYLAILFEVTLPSSTFFCFIVILWVF